MKWFSSTLVLLVLLALCSHMAMADSSSAPLKRMHVAPQSLMTYQNVTAAQLLVIWEQQLPTVQIIDVREPEEFIDGHIPGAFNFPLSTLENTFHNIPRDKDLYVHCKGGFRSIRAINYLETQGFIHLFNVQDGFDGWTGPVESFDKKALPVMTDEIKRAFPSAFPVA